MILEAVPWCIECVIRDYIPPQTQIPLKTIHTKAVHCVLSKAALICNDCQVAEFVNDDFLHRFPTITKYKTHYSVPDDPNTTFPFSSLH